MALSKEEQVQLKCYAKEIGKLLRKEHFGEYTTFEEGEKILRDALVNQVNSEVAQNFFAKSEKLEK